MAADILKDPARLAELSAAALLDTPAEDAFDRLTRLASKILDCPVSLVSLIDLDRQFFKSQIGLPEPWASAQETPLSHSFCKHLVITGQALVINDSRENPLFRENPAIRDLGVIAYLGMPLITQNGHTLGSLCAIDTRPREWSRGEVENLRELAVLAIREIELRTVALHFQENWLALREVEIQRDELVQMLVHDLRNPMGSMLMALDILETPDSPEEHAECLAVARKSGKSMLQMINDILDVSKSEVRGIRLELDEINPEQVLSFAHEQLSHSAADAGVVLRRNITKNLPLIWADAEKLRRVLVNLVANAIQHSPNGIVTTSAAMSDQGEALIVSVADTGEGIAEELRGQIFEKYGPIDSERVRRESSGLGLAFCKKVVEAHGGDLTVESVVGEGSTFRLTVSTKLRRNDITGLISHAISGSAAEF